MTYVEQALALSPDNFWACGDVSGTAAKLAGSYDLDPVGSLTYRVPGPGGGSDYAIRCTGGNYLSGSSHYDFSRTAGFTQSMHFKLRSTAQLDMPGGQEYCFPFEFYEPLHWEVYWAINGNEWSPSEAFGAVWPGNQEWPCTPHPAFNDTSSWHHLLLRLSQSDDWQIWLDGALYGSTTASLGGWPAKIAFGNGPMDIANLALWNRKLSDADIAALTATPAAPAGSAASAVPLLLS